MHPPKIATIQLMRNELIGNFTVIDNLQLATPFYYKTKLVLKFWKHLTKSYKCTYIAWEH